MASTILYKFQSGTTFEALPLPGSAARLFDVKKAIVKAKKLDGSGSMDFDLAVRNADTNEEYSNESMLLPRGTRLIVQRLPAARGHGFLARMARNEHAGVVPPGNAPHQPTAPTSAPSGFYTIDSRARDEDEFVSGNSGADAEQELAALQAVTNMQSGGPAMTGGYAGGPPRGGGAPRGGHGGGHHGGAPGGPPKPGHFRPNADPELRDQEKQLLPKKRATGIPRTFLNLSAPPQTELKEGEGAESNVPLLQPNALGFKELVNRGGGQSENTAGTRRDLDYALKLTATPIPDYLQCGICNGVVKNAMLLPWDPEGRTTCETCIRDALTQNGFRCPLTGMDGVSPDDLIPNVGLRKAADTFIKGVMEKVDEIEKQQVEEAETEEVAQKSTDANILDGDGVEKGVLVSKKMTMSSRKREEDDPFGGDGDDDFGGDVFAVESDKPKEAEPEAALEKDSEAGKNDAAATKDSAKDATAESTANKAPNTKQDKDPSQEESKNGSGNRERVDLSVSTDGHGGDRAPSETPEKQADTPTQHRRERRRGPPVGYSMGPAGGAAGGPQARATNNHDDGDHGGYRGGRGGRGFSQGGYHGGGYQDRGQHGRGSRGRGRGRGDYNHRDDGHDDDGNRGVKRSWDDSAEGQWDQQSGGHDRQDDWHDDRHDGRGSRDFRRDDRGGRGGYRSGGRGGGGYRGGRGGGGGGGGGGGYRGGRGYGGRGRY